MRLTRFWAHPIEAAASFCVRPATCRHSFSARPRFRRSSEPIGERASRKERRVFEGARKPPELSEKTGSGSRTPRTKRARSIDTHHQGDFRTPPPPPDFVFVRSSPPPLAPTDWGVV